MPVGPHILCPVKTMKSASRATTSIGMCGTDCEQSSSSSAPTWRTRSVIRAVALTVPRMFDMCTSETIFVRSLTRSSRSDSSSRPSSVTLNQRSVAPVRSQSSCHGTMLEWCSISEITISSPGPSRSRGSPVGEAFEKAYATRLIASVEFLVKTISSALGALMNAAILARAPSYASVASVPSVCTERETLRVVPRVVIVEHLEHLPRLVRGVGAVEVDQRVPVDLAVQDREVGPHLRHVEPRHPVVLRHAPGNGDRGHLDSVLSSYRLRRGRRRCSARSPRPRACRPAPGRPPRRSGRRRRRARSPA